MYGRSKLSTCRRAGLDSRLWLDGRAVISSPLVFREDGLARVLFCIESLVISSSLAFFLSRAFTVGFRTLGLLVVSRPGSTQKFQEGDSWANGLVVDIGFPWDPVDRDLK